MKILYFIIFFTFYSFFSLAETINDVVVDNNKRISKETIITLGDIKLGTNYDKSDLNEILKKLYETNFFSDVKVNFEQNILEICAGERIEEQLRHRKL